jgi:PAS domain S-box-containing protein
MASGDLVGPVLIHSEDAIRYANDAFCRLVGADSAADVTGRSPAEFVTDAYRDVLTEHIETLQADDGPMRGMVLEVDGADGTPVEAVVVSSLAEWSGETLIHTSVMPLSDVKEPRGASLQGVAADNSPIGVTIADATTDDEPLIYVNDEFVDLTGYHRSEAVGRNCRFLQGPATEPEPVAELRAAIRDRRPTTVELRNYRKDGSMFWNRISISPVRDTSGAVTHFLGFQEDISDAKLHEQERALFETHAEMSDQVMYVVDADRRIEYVNPAFERVTGYTAEEVLGESPRLFRSDRHDDAFYERMWETAAAGEVWEADLTNRTKSGEIYRSEQKIVPVVDDRGEVAHFTVIEPDVTDEQLATQALTVLNRVLRHNVRTSVNVIDGYVDLLESGVDDAERRAAIRSIRERTAALEDISEHTTALRNLLKGNEDPSPLPISRVAELIGEYRGTYDHATIGLDVEVPGERSIRNGSVFRIALGELVENAVEHTDRDHPQVDVTVRESAAANTVEVVVADDGPGIPESEWEVIRVGTETQLRHARSIGLWLVYWSITALGGSIRLSENEPRGSVFTLQVPTVAASPAESEPAGSAGS